MINKFSQIHMNLEIKHCVLTAKITFNHAHAFLHVATNHYQSCSCIPTCSKKTVINHAHSFQHGNRLIHYADIATSKFQNQWILNTEIY